VEAAGATGRGRRLGRAGGPATPFASAPRGAAAARVSVCTTTNTADRAAAGAAAARLAAREPRRAMAARRNTGQPLEFRIERQRCWTVEVRQRAVPRTDPPTGPGPAAAGAPFQRRRAGRPNRRTRSRTRARSSGKVPSRLGQLDLSRLRPRRTRNPGAGNVVAPAAGASLAAVNTGPGADDVAAAFGLWTRGPASHHRSVGHRCPAVRGAVGRRITGAAANQPVRGRPAASTRGLRRTPQAALVVVAVES
jgi:hypothetical protein